MKNLKQLEAAIVNTAPDIYFLNLDRHKDRFENLRNQLENRDLTWERIAAVDARQASEEELAEYTDPTGPISRMGAGARACTAGHFKIWKKLHKYICYLSIFLNQERYFMCVGQIEKH